MVLLPKHFAGLFRLANILLVLFTSTILMINGATPTLLHTVFGITESGVGALAIYITTDLTVPSP